MPPTKCLGMKYSLLCDGTHKEIGSTAPWYWGGVLETGSITEHQALQYSWGTLSRNRSMPARLRKALGLVRGPFYPSYERK